MKLLFFIDNLGFGGKERRLLELLRHLDKIKTVEIHLVLAKDHIVYREVYDTRVQIHYALRKGLKKDPRVFYKFYRIVKKVKPDIIHVWGNIEAIYALPSQLLFSIPLINSQIANVPTELSHPFLNHKLTFPFADRVIGNSSAGLLAYEAPANRSRVIYNGFDWSRIENLANPDQILEKFNIIESFVVGMVASFAKRKDYGTLMHSINELVLEQDNIRFICVGDGEFEIYRSMLSEKGKEKTLFLGHQEDIESIMQVCDVGILTTKTEGIPNSILEFMALEKSVVVAGAGGCEELVEDKINGFLLESGDIEGIVRSILCLKTNFAMRSEFGKASRRIVEEKFSIRQMIDQYLDEYKLLMKSN